MAAQPTRFLSCRNILFLSLPCNLREGVGWGAVGCKNVHVTCVELEAFMLRGCYGHSKVMLCTSQAYAMLR